LRELASDYEVAHTTLGRYFERPEVASELRQAAQRLRAERRSGARNRRCAGGPGCRPRPSASRRAGPAPPWPRSLPADAALALDYEVWLDGHDAFWPLTRADLHSQSDEIAARVVAAGGGMQAVIDATGYHTRENVVRAIDSAILVQALDNDILEQAQPPPL